MYGVFCLLSCLGMHRGTYLQVVVPYLQCTCPPCMPCAHLATVASSRASHQVRHCCATASWVIDFWAHGMRVAPNLAKPSVLSHPNPLFLCWHAPISLATVSDVAPLTWLDCGCLLRLSVRVYASDQ